MRLDLTCKKCASSLNYERVGNTDYYVCYRCNSSKYKKPETVEVRIIACEKDGWWYADKIGETFEVEAPSQGDVDYHVYDNDPSHIRLIKRTDAVEVGKYSSEDMIIALSREVANLKATLQTVQESVRRFAETATEADYQAGKALELIKTGKAVECECKNRP